MWQLWPNFLAIVLAFITAVALVGCGKSDRRSGRQETPQIPVELVTAERRAMERVVAVSGTFAAQEASTLSAKVPGRLQTLSVDLGSVVGRGDLLAQVEPRDYELGLQQAVAALAQARTALGLSPLGDDDRIELEQVSGVKQAKAVLDEATKNRERVKSLSASGISPASEVDTVESAYLVARTRYEGSLEDARGRMATVAQRRAECEMARKRLADATLYAPFDGAVQLRPASIGEYLSEGSPVLQLVKTDPLRLRLRVPERESALVRTGQVVRAFIEGDTNAYAGRIARLSPALDEESRMLLVEADVRAQGSLRPGLFARAQIVVNENEQSLSIPSSAILTFAGIEKVVLALDGKALEKNVVTGRRGPDWVEVVSGLEPGQKVVLTPQGLRTGQPVSISKGSAGRTGTEAERGSGS
jgi:RND family efflux transporter MFP subunit